MLQDPIVTASDRDLEIEVRPNPVPDRGALIIDGRIRYERLSGGEVAVIRPTGRQRPAAAIGSALTGNLFSMPCAGCYIFLSMGAGQSAGFSRCE